ncbi:hypothetical protein [Cohnella silvisoli]|uniref:Uncharacterized protein n=1 Tax=Cohnella silvisoli TaxID=2873699 RepID=A0ABV1KST8_9BACL|nr:hypothetical protein [Cohnella silvisoli]MCD9021305.1 hypothetical protein [Cohnella silvisoli]
MKWKRLLILAALILVVGWSLNIREKLGFAKDYDLELNVVSAVLMDADTGKWLYLSNAQDLYLRRACLR